MNRRHFFTVCAAMFAAPFLPDLHIRARPRLPPIKGWPPGWILCDGASYSNRFVHRILDTGHTHHTHQIVDPGL